MKPTKAQKKRRRTSFEFTYRGVKSWFYLCEEDGASFHQPASHGQQNVFGLRISTLINALKKCGYIALFLCLPAVVEAGGVPSDCGINEHRDCETSVHPTIGPIIKPAEKQKKVVIPYADFLVMLSKVEHKDKLLNQCAAERGVLIKLNDENGTIKKLNLQQIEALEGEVEAHRKLGETQEQIVQAMEQKLAGLTGELTREKRLSRYKSEFIGMGALIIGVALWIAN